MAKIYPYFHCVDARGQAEFYAKALNGHIVSIQTFGEAPQVDEAIKDKVMHLVLQVQELTIFMADSVFETIQRGNGLDLCLELQTEEQAQIAFEALADGGNILMPFEKQFWGAMFGRLQDKYGVHWQVVTPH